MGCSQAIEDAVGRDDLPDGVIWFPSRMDFLVSKTKCGKVPPKKVARFHVTKKRGQNTTDTAQEVRRQRRAALELWATGVDGGGSSSAADVVDTDVVDSDTLES